MRLMWERQEKEDSDVPAPKSKTKPRHRPIPATTAKAFANGEVLTLAETAEYLRVTADEVARLVREQGLPGRKLGDDWRLLKAALPALLGAPPSNKGRLLMQSGAFRADPGRRR